MEAGLIPLVVLTAMEKQKVGHLLIWGVHFVFDRIVVLREFNF